jgi:lipopolysaccharide export system protein LptC
MLSLALLTFWLERAVREEEPRGVTIRRHDPDYIVDKFVITSFDAKGATDSTLSAAKMLHYPDDDSTDLVAPRIVQTKPGEPRMTLTADRGTLSQNGDEVFLFGNVTLVRDADADRPAMRLSTSFLHVVTARSLALTDREVTIVEDHRTLSGRGMEYNSELGLLRLQHDVRGRFESRKIGQ